MHITIRRYKVESPKEAARITNERFIPLISKVAGFVAYYGIETGEDSWTTVSVFERPQGLRNPTALQRNLSRTIRTRCV
jgi:hypothetical protein